MKLLQSAEKALAHFCRCRTGGSFVCDPIVRTEKTLTCLVRNRVRDSACFHGDTLKTTKGNVTRDHKCAHSNGRHCTEQMIPPIKKAVCNNAGRNGCYHIGCMSTRVAPFWHCPILVFGWLCTSTAHRCTSGHRRNKLCAVFSAVLLW